MRPKRYFIASMLCAAVLSSERVYANGTIVVPITTTRNVQKDSGPSFGGFLHRLCGRGAETSGPRFVTATVVQYAIVPDPEKPCNHPAFCRDAQGNCWPCHPGWTCFPTCFVYTPCKCCHHGARYLKPGSSEANSWQAQILIWQSQGRTDWFVRIQDPGPLAHLLHRKHFDRVN
jgi:hypothetical protein